MTANIVIHHAIPAKIQQFHAHHANLYVICKLITIVDYVNVVEECFGVMITKNVKIAMSNV
jgi:hypothetical protein